MKRALLVLACLLLPATAASAAVQAGPRVAIGQGHAWSWIESQNGRPTALGISLSDGALDGLPTARPEYEYVLPLPRGRAVPPFTHAVIDWNPQGHPPAGVYTVPHFDFHFYTISEKTRAAMTAAGPDAAAAAKPPESRYLPKGYTNGNLPPVPHMGLHWVPSSAPEFQGKPFTATLVYGSYDGRLAFIEPMVTREFLLLQPDLEQEVPQPAAYQLQGWFPTTWAVRYEPQSATYQVVLGGLKKR